MERIKYNNPKKIFYYASSIADMANSRDKVMEEVLLELGYPEWNKPIKRKDEKPVRFDFKTGRLELNIAFTFPIPRPLSRFIPPICIGKEKNFEIRYRSYRLANILVFIPLVRHIPYPGTENSDLPCDFDPKDNMLTVFDVTDSCEVSKIPEAYLKKMDQELRPNFKVLKSTHWQSDVLLKNTYRSDGEDDYALYYVRNRIANQPQDDAIRSFVGKLATENFF